MSALVSFNKRSLDCPGLEYRDRAGGKRVPIWIAPKRAVKAGYLPKSVPLGIDLSEIELASVCRRLQAEVLEFLSGAQRTPTSAFDGSFGSMANIFQTDKMSPFIIPGRLNWKTKRNMAHDIKHIVAEIGGRQLHSIKAADAQFWYDTFKAPAVAGRGVSRDRIGKERLTQARRFITTIRQILRFGAMIEVSPECTAECKRLADKEFGALGVVRCNQPIVRVSEVTFDMVEEVCDLARGYGYHSVALAFATQFETGLRQLDCIGEWVPDDEAVRGHDPKGNGRAKSKNFVWKHGIVWGHDIDRDLILTKLTSKSKFTKVAKFDLKLCPLVMRELEHVPLDRRIGPFIVQEAGRAAGQPWERTYFSNRCKELLREMAITDSRFIGVANMDCRSGAITEAFDGVDSESAAASNVQKLYGQHATAKQTAHYNRETLDKSRAISMRRIASREAQIAERIANKSESSA